MYLHTLALHGFKSFAEKTTLQFAPGVTAIVGPNGCGKSNIVDAVRWAIGEQRPTALRSEKMENVIFNGTTDRRPVGMAEVELTIENNRGVLPTEYSEVAVGRRLFRDGASEYLMNGHTCRLKDITGLFMDTGMGADAYSVIELKMIDEILSDSAEDRRRLFEEAAGITRYKKRRRQALRKLDATQADLTRLGDLTDEVQKTVRRLKRQAKKAAEHEELAARLHDLELHLAKTEHDRLTARRAALQEQIEAIEETVAAHTRRQTQTEHRLEDLRATLAEREAALARQRAALQKRRDAVRTLEGELRLHEERLQTARRDRERLLREQEEGRTRRGDLTRRREQFRQELAEARPALETAEAALEAGLAARDRTRTAAEEQREALGALRRREQSADEERAERRRRLDRLTSRLEMTEDERERTLDRLDALDDEAARRDARLRTADTARDEAQSAADAARAALEEAEAEHAREQEALEEADAALRRAERARDAARAEVQLLESLVASYDAFPDAVRFLAASDAWRPAGGLRTVADVLATGEADRVALDAALGAWASCLVAATDDEARAAIDLLRAEEQGQSHFIVLDRLPDAPPADAPPVEGARPLRDAVRVAAPSYAPLAGVLLASCYLTGSLEEAQALAARTGGGARFFARSGEWADGDGRLRGGSRQTAASPVAGRLGRREQLDAAREEQDRLEALCTEKRQAVEKRREALETLSLGAQREALRAAEQALREADTRRDRIRYEHETADARRQEQADRAEQLAEEIGEHRTAIGALREAAHEAEARQSDLRARRADAEDAFQSTDDAHRQSVDAFGEANITAVEARNRLANAEREAERTAERLREQAARAETRTDRLAALREEIDAAQEQQAALRSDIDAAREARDAHEATAGEGEAALAEVKNAIGEVERALRGLRQEREAHLRQENQLAVQQAEVATRLEDLEAGIEEDFEQTVEALPAPEEDFDEQEARREVGELRRKVRQIGTVNPLALEEYEEENERLGFLREQQADLEQAEATLLETIREINTTAARRFDKTFGAIRDSFAGLFARLFGEGAAARLALDDPDDPLESTIEIFARPRGKKPSVLAQLSSGEKALTAIALLFAIYLVKPSPFCILDEVDAPLDDANTGRFMNLIRDFSADTQFILVTHNKRTMELADRMYGVTMQEQGVSTLVGVAFDEAVEMAEAV